MLWREIRDLKNERRPWLWTERFNIVKILSLPKVIYKYCCCCWAVALSVQFNRSVVSDSLWLQHARPLFLHHLLKFAQVHVHCIGDAVQPSHSLTPFSPSALNLSQHQGLVQWVVSQRAFHSLSWSMQSEMFFWNSPAFSIIRWILAISSLVPLPFLNPAWTSGISWFT